MPIESHLKRNAVEIFMAGVAAVEPGRVVRSHLKLEEDILVAGEHRLPLHPDTRVFVVSAGKAGALMAGAVEKVLGDRIHRGLVIVKYGHLAPVEMVTLLEAGHPIPDEAGVRAASMLRELLGDLLIIGPTLTNVMDLRVILVGGT